MKTDSLKSNLKSKKVKRSFIRQSTNSSRQISRRKIQKIGHLNMERQTLLDWAGRIQCQTSRLISIFRLSSRGPRFHPSLGQAWTTSHNSVKTWCHFPSRYSLNQHVHHWRRGRASLRSQLMPFSCTERSRTLTVSWIKRNMSSNSWNRRSSRLATVDIRAAATS